MDCVSTLDEGPKSKVGHMIFIQDRFLLGGIEVLEMKVVEALLDVGCDVTLAFNVAGDVPEACGAFRTFTHEGYSDLISRSHQLVSTSRKPIILVTLHPSAAMAAICISERLQRAVPSIDVRVFQWVSHSRAFFFSGRVVSALLKRAFFTLPTGSTYFMNEPARLAHFAHWNRSLEEYKILQIVGRDPTAVNTSACVARVRIVSVGRLVPFKSYNRHAPAIVAKLRSDGLDVTWDIWGYGPDESIISEAIESLGVSSSVRLLGSIDHSQFDETVSGYDVFIGMGTAVLEAGKTETPTLVAVENTSDRCYGFLYETPADSVGDVVEGHSQALLIDCIREFFETDEEGRRSIGRLCRESASRRESSVGEFRDAIIQSEPLPPKKLGDRMNLLLFNAYFWFKAIKKRMAEGA